LSPRGRAIAIVMCINLLNRLILEAFVSKRY